jgi:hypothetical protein
MTLAVATEMQRKELGTWRAPHNDKNDYAITTTE